MVWLGYRIFEGAQSTDSTDKGEGFGSGHYFPLDIKFFFLTFQFPNELAQGGFSFKFFMVKGFRVVSESVFELGCCHANVRFFGGGVFMGGYNCLINMPM